MMSPPLPPLPPLGQATITTNWTVPAEQPIGNITLTFEVDPDELVTEDANRSNNLAQISPIMSSIIKDFTGDGILDILIAGNLFDAEVETVRHDGSNGLFLKGTTKGFVPLRVLESGFYAPLNVKSIIDIELNNHMHTVLVGSNDNRVTAFSYKSN